MHGLGLDSRPIFFESEYSEDITMKTNLDDLFKNDESLEKEGVWFTIKEGIGFLVRRVGGSNSKKMEAALARYFKPYAYQIQNGTLDEKKERQIVTRVFVEACVVDWKGIEIDGKIAPFSVETAIEFFMNMPELFDAVQQYARDSKNYREHLGNS